MLFAFAWYAASVFACWERLCAAVAWKGAVVAILYYFENMLYCEVAIIWYGWIGEWVSCVGVPVLVQYQKEDGERLKGS